MKKVIITVTICTLMSSAVFAGGLIGHHDLSDNRGLVRVKSIEGTKIAVDIVYKPDNRRLIILTDVYADFTQELILKAISYHNRLNIPDDESHICIFFSKLLRDADKLDIYHLVSTYYCSNEAQRSAAIELDLPDTPEVSEEIMTNISERKLISMHQLKSLNEFKLLQMAWIYDYSGPRNLDSVISDTWDTKRGGPSGRDAQELSAFI